MTTRAECTILIVQFVLEQDTGRFPKTKRCDLLVLLLSRTQDLEIAVP